MPRSLSHHFTTALALVGMVVLFSPLAMSAVFAIAGQAA
jgi:hypothetical protein